MRVLPHLKVHGKIWWNTLVRFTNDHGFEHAGNLTFLGTLALFPFLICLLAISGILGQTEAGQKAVEFLLANLPVGIAATLRGPVENIISASGGKIATFSMLFALWSSIQGVEAARQSVIHAYDRRDFAASYLKRLLADLVLVIVTVVCITLAMSLIVLAPVILHRIEMWLNLPRIIHDAGFWVRITAAPLLLFLALLATYRIFTPRIPGHSGTYFPGAALTVVVWFALGQGMAIYLKHADRYDIVYGSLAGVILLQLFIYVISGTFILGAHLNASYSRANGNNVETT